MKLTSILLSALFLLSFTSCTTNSNLEDEHKDNSEISSKNEEQDFTDEDKDKLVFLSSQNYALDQVTENEINKYLSDISVPYIIDFEYLADTDYKDNAFDFIENNQADIIFSGVDYLSKNNVNLTEDYFLTLNEYLDSEDGKLLKNSVPNLVWNSLKHNDKIYGVKGSYVPSVSPSYIVNKKYMEKYNISEEDLQVPLSQLAPMLNELYINENIKPLLISSINQLVPEGSYGYYDFCINDSGDIELITKQEDIITQYKSAKDYTEQGYLNEFYTSGNEFLSFDDVFIIYSNAFTPTNMYISYVKNEQGNIIEKDVDYIEVPLSENIYALNPSTSFVGISKNSEYIDYCFDFITRYMTDEKLSTLFISGVENVHYTVGENDKIHPIYDGEIIYKDYSYAYGNSFITKAFYNEFDNKNEILIEQCNNAIETPFFNINFSLSKNSLMKIQELCLDDIVNWKEFEDFFSSMSDEEKEAFAQVTKERYEAIGDPLWTLSGFKDCYLQQILKPSNDQTVEEILAEYEECVTNYGIDILKKELENIILENTELFNSQKEG